MSNQYCGALVYHSVNSDPFRKFFLLQI